MLLVVCPRCQGRAVNVNGVSGPGMEVHLQFLADEEAM